jgi:hypothetical protein
MVFLFIDHANKENATTLMQQKILAMKNEGRVKTCAPILMVNIFCVLGTFKYLMALGVHFWLIQTLHREN